jgi:hypothetical protein
MSRYKAIATKITDEAHLCAALQELQLTYEQGEALTMRYSSETPQVVVRRQQIGTRFDDLGFARQSDGTYRAISSNHDATDRQKSEDWLRKITQTYGKHKAIALAKAKGLNVVSESNENGVIRLRLRGYADAG